MTPIDLSAIRKRAEEAAERAARATRGPWRHVRHSCVVERPDADPHCPSKKNGRDFCSACDDVIVSSYNSEADAAFVCAARVDVPALSADVVELAKEVERWRFRFELLQDAAQVVAERDWNPLFELIEERVEAEVPR